MADRGTLTAVQDAQHVPQGDFEHLMDPVGFFGDQFDGQYYGPW